MTTPTMVYSCLTQMMTAPDASTGTERLGRPGATPRIPVPKWIHAVNAATREIVCPYKPSPDDSADERRDWMRTVAAVKDPIRCSECCHILGVPHP